MATFLAGDNTAYPGFAGRPPAGNCLYDSDGYVAAASGTVDTGYVSFQSGTGNFKVLVYDSGKNLLGSSDAGAVGSGFVAASFSTKPTITSGNTYYLAVVCDSTGGYIHTGGSSGGRIVNDSSGTYATPPDPISGANWSEIVYAIGIYVEGTAGGGAPPATPGFLNKSRAANEGITGNSSRSTIINHGGN